MTARQNFYAESVGLSTKNTTGEETKVSLVFTPDANASYLYIWSALIQASSTSADVKVSLRNGAADTGTLLGAGNFEDKDITDFHPVFGLAKESFGEAPAAQTITLNFEPESTNTAEIKEARIIAIKLTADDVFAEDVSDQTNTDTAFATAVTLNWTPGSAGDYLLLGSCESKFSTGTGEVITKMVHGGIDYGESTVRPKDLTNYHSSGHFVRLPALSGAQAATLQFARSATAAGTANCRRARLAVLRLNSFANVYHGEDRSRTTTTSPTFGDKATASGTSVAADHLILACGIRDAAATANSALTKVREGTTDLIAEASQENTVSSTVIDVPGDYCQMMRRAETAAAKNWHVAFASENSVSTGMDEAAVVVIELNEAAAGAALLAIRNESGEVAEALLRNLGLARLRTETVEVAEAALRFLGLRRLRSETAEIAEDRQRNLGMLRLNAETGEISEDRQRNLGMLRLRSETGDIAEAGARVVGLRRVLSETVNIAEAVVSRLGLLRLRAETAEIATARLNLLGFIRLRAETVEAAEAVLRFLGLTSLRAETADLAETSPRFLGLLRLRDETAQAVETALRNLGLRRVHDEDAEIAEQRLRFVGLRRVRDEAAEIAEAVLRRLGLTSTRDESVPVSETRDFIRGLTATIAESVAVAESFLNFVVVSVRGVIAATLRVYAALDGGLRAVPALLARAVNYPALMSVPYLAPALRALARIYPALKAKLKLEPKE